jgi:hypothetical protein
LTELGNLSPADIKRPRKKGKEPFRRSEYFHPNFRRNRKDLLPLIVRKLHRYEEEYEPPIEDRSLGADQAEDDVQGPAPGEDQEEDNVQRLSPVQAEDRTVDDTWKAILGPVVSNERGDASAAPHGDVPLYATSEPSTQTNSPEDSIFGDYTKNRMTESFNKAPFHEPVSLVDNLDRVIQELPQDPQTLIVLLQKSQLLTSHIQERLGMMIPNWRVMTPGPSLPNWPGANTGWNATQQHPFTVAFSSAGPYVESHPVLSPFTSAPF